MQIQLPKSLRGASAVTMPPRSALPKQLSRKDQQLVLYREMNLPKTLRSKPRKPKQQTSVSFSTNNPVSYSSLVRPLSIRSTSCPSVGSEPGFGFTAKGLSASLVVTTSSGVQTAQDQFATCVLGPCNQWMTTVTDHVSSASGYLTGAVANTIGSVFRAFWCKRMKIRWIPALPTSASGDIAICISPMCNNETQPDPTSIVTLLDQPVSAMGSVYRPLELSWSSGPLPKQLSALYGNSQGSGNTSTGALSVFAEFQPQIVVGFSGIASGAGSSVTAGRFEVESEWQLYGPGVSTTS